MLHVRPKHARSHLQQQLMRPRAATHCEVLGHAGGIEKGSLTLEPCRQLVDDWVCVSEQEIAVALLGLLEHDDLRVEGALLQAAVCTGAAGIAQLMFIWA